jgi:DNA-binding transcriptional LysR family regulator
MTHLPSLSLLRCFEAAAKYQSFTRAARDLGMTQGAVSRQVRELEAQIGVTLFRPTGRGVALTEAGRSLANHVQDDLDRLRQTLRRAGAVDQGHQVLAIGVLPTFGSHWLAPRLRRFRDTHPGVELEIHSRTEPFDLIRHGIDLAIHFGRSHWVDGDLLPLCPENLVAIAAPDILAQPGAVLPNLPLLHLRTRQNAWAAHFETLGLPVHAARRGMVFDQFATMIAAAIHGAGVAIVPTYLIERDLDRGALVPVLPHLPPKGMGDMYYVVMPKGVHNPTAARFRHWIMAQARASSQNRSGAGENAAIDPTGVAKAPAL